MSHSIPPRPSLELDKKRAKRLLRRARRGEADAILGLRAHPRLAPLNDTEIAASARLGEVQLVVARSYGFSNWQAWKQFVDTRAQERAERGELVLRDLCSNEFRRGLALLVHEPELARGNVFIASACGELEHVQRLLAEHPELAHASGGPLACPALAYACFSRFLRRDPERAARIRLVARELLARGADPNAHFYEGEGTARVGQTCLYAASGIANDPELTTVLLEAGADIDERVPEPAHEALYHAAEFRDTRCLELLLQAKPDPAFVTYCLTRALDFPNERAALLFLEHGADPNHRVPWHNLQGHLHKAVFFGRSRRTLEAMLARGADPNLQDARGLSPYRYAVRLGHGEIVALLEAHGADARSATPEDRKMGALASGSARPDADGVRPVPEQLEWAARRNDLPLITRLLDAGAEIDLGGDLPPLHAACVTGQLEAAALLVERGANLALKNRYGGDAIGSTLWGSLNCAYPEGGVSTLLPEEIVHGRWPEIIELLLRAGVPAPRSTGYGSEAAQDALRRMGVSDVDEG